ncbi:Uma2 family endonuclease [Nostoc sp. LEGE 12450]|nr:Uma2 family endonuclease [Nostoc sp. LEGE 12450]
MLPNSNLLVSRIWDFCKRSIDPDQLRVTVYRLNQAPVVLQNGDMLTLPGLLPGWEMTISEL